MANPFRWAAAWTLYGLGDVACRILQLNDESERWAYFWYPVYSRLMTWSSDVQGDNSFGPWNWDNREEP